jgi:Rrf2 family nitric oxide-sensitive transcriptional repressor
LTDHAFRVLIYLTERDRAEGPGAAGASGPASSRPATILELSMQLGIPVNATQKAITRLSQIGVISGHRGRQGGILLDHQSVTLRLGWLFRQLEQDLGLVTCRRDHGPACPLVGYCRLMGILDQSLQAFIAELDHFTLADLGDDPALLGRLQHKRQELL